MSDTPPPARFSPGRVLAALAAVGTVALAAGVFAAFWFIPWPKAKPTPPTLPIKEHVEALRKAAQRKAA